MKLAGGCEDVYNEEVSNAWGSFESCMFWTYGSSAICYPGYISRVTFAGVVLQACKANEYFYE
jgi:hypothetical protein